MKQILIILALIVSTVTACSQTMILRAHKGEATFNENWTNSETLEFYEKSILINVDYDDGMITIDNKKQSKFFIKDSYAEETIDGDDYLEKHIISECINKEGDECWVVVSWFDREDIAYAGKYNMRVRIIFSDVWFGYYCNSLSIEL